MSRITQRFSSVVLTKYEERYIADHIGGELCQLARELDLCDTVQTEIKEEKNKVQATLDTIKKWQKKDGYAATKQVMVNAMRHIQRCDIADHLEGSADLSVDVRTAIGILRNKYLKSELSKIPWDDPPSILPMNEVYVDLELLEADVFDRQHSIDEIELQQLFSVTSFRRCERGSHKPRYLILGGPGYGKSSLIKKIAYDWACEKDYMKKFDLAVVVQLRNIESSLFELIEKESRLSLHQIRETENTTLLLLDGYDELPSKDNSDVHELLQRLVFPNVTVVLSSRVRIALPGEDIPFWDTLIRVKGFNQERAKEFLRRYLQKDDVDDVWKALISKLPYNSTEMLTSPLFLMLLGRMQEKQQLTRIQSTADLYEQAYNFIVRWSLVRKKILRVDQRLDLFNGTGCVFSELLHLYGELAWNHLKKGLVHIEKSTLLQQCRCEKLNDFGDDLILDMGFLMQSKAQSETRQQVALFEPIHKSFMDFAAALYFMNKCQRLLDDKEQQRYIESEVKSTDVNVLMHEMGCFVSFLKELGEKKSTGSV